MRKREEGLYQWNLTSIFETTFLAFKRPYVCVHHLEGEELGRFAFGGLATKHCQQPVCYDLAQKEGYR